MTNFPHKVVSTYRVLMKKAFNEDIDETWIDWAIEMIREGYESDNLYILAGINKPYHQFDSKDNCVWSNLMSGDWAWSKAVHVSKLPTFTVETMRGLSQCFL